MRRFRGCQLSWHLKLPNIYEGMIDASVNTRLYYYWVLQIQAWVYFWKSVCSFRVDSILKWRVCIKLKDSWQRAFLWCMSQTSRDRVNSGRVRTHEKNSGEAVRRLGTIIQSIFCAQSGASNRLTVWKWSGESRYPGALPPMLENFRRAFSPGPTDGPWSPRMRSHKIWLLSISKFFVYCCHSNIDFIWNYIFTNFNP